MLYFWRDSGFSEPMIAKEAPKSPQKKSKTISGESGTRRREGATCRQAKAKQPMTKVTCAHPEK
jgi:hypothetical protein